jgi:gamma-glutamyltranspeptidase / glutathione hydrolase / leukotriene-C4 hydrolase
MARDGFAVTPLLYDRLQSIVPLVLADPRWGAVYAPNGTLAQVGDIIRRVDLAATLELIANNGSADRTHRHTHARTHARTHTVIMW